MYGEREFELPVDTQDGTSGRRADARFRRTVERIGSEAFWLRTYQAAINGMKVDAIGLDFFRVSLNALKDARLIRLIRILEDGRDRATFWYLFRSNAKLVSNAAQEGRLDLHWLRDIAEKLRSIRNKTFVHIDKDGVFDPQQYYQSAGITNNDVDRAIDGIWQTMLSLHRTVLGREMKHDVYTGEDIRKLADLRDAELRHRSRSMQ